MQDNRKGELVVLVVQLRALSSGQWDCRVHGAAGAKAIPVPQGIVTIRYWREMGTGLIRGTIQREGSDLIAPFQCNRQMELLVSTWLTGNNAAT